MYTKNPDLYDGSKFELDLRKAVKNFNNELSDILSKYNALKLNQQDFNLLCKTKNIKDALENILKNVQSEKMHS